MCKREFESLANYLLIFVSFVLFLFICGCETAPLHRGYRWYCRGAYGQAIETLTYYLDEYSSDNNENKEARAAGFFYRGLSKAELGQIQEADVDYREALARVPDFFYASFNIGVGLIRQQQYDSALEMFRKSWNSMTKAECGELDDSLLWNRKVFLRDRSYCFFYYGMVLIMCGEIDEIGVLLKESERLTLKENRIIVARELFRKVFVRELTLKECRMKVESWLNDLEKGRGLRKFSGR